MNVWYHTRTQEKKGEGNNHFLLANKKGGYLFLGDSLKTHFTGLNFFLADEWTLFKTIENIYVNQTPKEIVHKYSSVERHYEYACEQFRLFNKTLYYEVDKYEGLISIDLDMRRIYDNASDDRHYKIYYERDVIVVEYSHVGESHYLVIAGAESFTFHNAWEPRHYFYDAMRGEQSDRWVYKALSIHSTGNKRLSFTYGRDKEQTLSDARVAWNDWDLIAQRLKQHTQSIKTTNGVAYSTAVFALETCIAKPDTKDQRTGVFAGYPWFFQFWARDELISLQGLVLAEKYSLVKEILHHHTQHIDEKGRLPNMTPSSTLGSADAIGWLWKRTGDFLEHLEERKLLWEYYTQEELHVVCAALEDSLRKQRRHFERNGLLFNDKQETWMDTHGDVGDYRAGARIEIQALTLASLSTLIFFYRILKKGNGKEFRDWQKILKEKVRGEFYREGKLYDGQGDATQRPNIFIAAYVYPELLSKKEWTECFNFALSKLWLSWGGFSSIDSQHPWYCKDYVAYKNKSYHRGDSWYWVNNVAALAMKNIDEERFKEQIQKITDASVSEMLWQGVPGHCAELSSARMQNSSGCLAQAWSAATLVELLSSFLRE